MKGEIAKDQTKILALRESVQPGGMNYDGMPRSKNASSKVEEVSLKIVALENDIKCKEISIADCERIKNKTLAEYRFAVALFGDIQIEDAIRMRYFEFKSWTAIASELGYPNTADGIRHRVDYFLRKTQTEEFKKKYSEAG